MANTKAAAVSTRTINTASATELVEMIATARQYQNNVQVLQTAKTLIAETLRLGQ